MANDDREGAGNVPAEGEGSSLAPSEPEAFPAADGGAERDSAPPRPQQPPAVGRGSDEAERAGAAGDTVRAPAVPPTAPPPPTEPPAAAPAEPTAPVAAAPPPPAVPAASAAEPPASVPPASAPSASVPPADADDPFAKPGAPAADSATAVFGMAGAGVGGSGVGGGSGMPPYGFPGGPYGSQPNFVMPPAPRRRRPNPLVVTALVTALLAGGVGGGIGAWLADRDNGSSSSSVNTSSGPVDPASLNRAPESVAGIAAKSLPGTVTIKTKSGGTGRGGQEGTGAGFVLDDQGHILTNNHVVSLAADGGELTVTFSDGKTVPGKIVGRAEGYDLAVVKVDGVQGLKPLPLGDSSAVAVGDPVLAIGSPYGLDGTVTQGIISAKNRPVASGDQEQTSYMNALQTDASINPGNSGGPLLDAQGRVVGVNSAIRSAGGGGSDPFGGQQQAGSIGLGFAIPIDQAKWVADTLIKTGKPVYAQVGVIPDPDYRGVGARIRQATVQGQVPVTPGGPADKAGLKAGDVITKLGDRPVTGYEELFSEIWSHKPGEKVKITYQRDGKENTTELTLGQRDGDQTN